MCTFIHMFDKFVQKTSHKLDVSNFFVSTEKPYIWDKNLFISYSTQTILIILLLVQNKYKIIFGKQFLKTLNSFRKKIWKMVIFRKIDIILKCNVKVCQTQNCLPKSLKITQKILILNFPKTSSIIFEEVDLLVKEMAGQVWKFIEGINI